MPKSGPTDKLGDFTSPESQGRRTHLANACHDINSTKVLLGGNVIRLALMTALMNGTRFLTGAD